jgi:Lon protease-like protein
MALPSTIPVILLAECNVFPHALLPLNIFEPRYRAMLAHALDADRFMAVATLREAGEEAWDEGDENIEKFSCAGLLRACVGQPDGTFRLIVQGVQRIRITGWAQYEPFRIAECEPVPSLIGDKEEALALARRTIALARASLPAAPAVAAQFDVQFGALEDPQIVADVIGYNFISRASDRQPLLGMERVEERLKYILSRLAPVAPAAE